VIAAVFSKKASQSFWRRTSSRSVLASPGKIRAMRRAIASARRAIACRRAGGSFARPRAATAASRAVISKSPAAAEASDAAGDLAAVATGGRRESSRNLREEALVTRQRAQGAVS